MSKSLARVRAALSAANIDAEILEMPSETKTAQQAADAAGCEVDQILKSIILRTETSDQPILFLTAGSNRVSVDKASALVGEPLGKADAAFIRARTGFAIGGVSPVGHINPIRAFMDPRLLEFPIIWAAAGTPRHNFAVDPKILQQNFDVQVAVFT